MAHQLEHIFRVPAKPPFLGQPLTLLRAQVLAQATIRGRRSASELVRYRNVEICRTITWLEHSWLMNKIPDGWRLTPTGALALAATFHAVMLCWRNCPSCKALRPEAAFVGKRGRKVQHCQSCRDALALRGLELFR